MKSNSRRFTPSAFTLVALLVIVAVLAILAALFLPTLAGAHDRSRQIQCVNNLKQCGLAFRIWEGDNNDKYPMATDKDFGTQELVAHYFQVMSNELSTPRILICPADTRTAAMNFVRLKNQNVSYFIGLDANEANPQMFLDGDRNITGDSAPQNGILKLVPGGAASWTTAIHNNQGNLGLADGAVMSFSNSGLREALNNSGDPTNTWHIALPE
ncbi:MAG TPA: type II secretion system protein [Verrucomicrobiae bacterium]